MIGFLRFTFFIVLFAALALWLADRPGTAHIVWRDYVIDTSAAFLAVCIAAIAYVLHMLFRLWHFVRHGPTFWRLRRKIDKQQLGEDQLARGLVAIAAGNSAEAGRFAVAARKNLGKGIAAQWLQAQAAQMAGDKRAAHEIFRNLAANEDSAMLGYRGLIVEAKREGKWEDVDSLLNEIQRLKPVTPWLSLMRMESAARRGQWDEAEKALAPAVNARLLESNAARRARAALRIAASRAASLSGNKNEALVAAEQAAKLAPDWLPPIINLAEALVAADHARAATRIIERAWKTMPNLQLAQILFRIVPSPLDAFKAAERLVKINDTAPESYIAAADAALAADIWGEARRHLMACLPRHPTQGVYKRLAELEHRERHDDRAASIWLAKAADAPSDPIWLCRACGGAQETWAPICLPCGSFDMLEWQSAGKSRGAISYTKDYVNND